MSTRKARVAIIGTGWWSTYTHIPGLLANPRAELVALCDADAAKLAAAASHYSVATTYTDVSSMLTHEQLDGVVVATYHTTHHDVAKGCLEAGLHVLVEKPMVLRSDHARDLVATAARVGKELIVGYPWHFSPNVRLARDIIAGGTLGPVQLATSLMASMVIEFYRGNPEAYRPVFGYPVTGPTTKTYSDVSQSGGGQGHLQVTHSAGLLLFVTGLRAARVSAFMENFDVPVDLVDAINVRFEGGALGVIGSTGNVGVGDGGQHDLRVYCANGYLLYDTAGGRLTVRRHGQPPTEYGPLDAETAYPRFATAANLVDVVLGTAANGSPGEVGLRCVELLEAAYTSARADGAPVALPHLAG